MYVYCIQKKLSVLIVLQVREAKGKLSSQGTRRGRGQAPGQGFPLTDSKTLEELIEDPKYSDVLSGLKAQLLRLLRDGIELVLIERGEI